QPRFIFKDWGNTQPNRDGFVTRERERPLNDNTRRGVTGRDLGGLGIIPPPDVRDRRDGRGGVVRSGGTDNRASGGVERGRDRQDNQERPTVLPPRQRDLEQQPRDQQQPQVQPRVRDTEPRRVEPRSEPRSEPRRVEPRSEPRNEPRRVEPRNEPRNEPRSQPRAEPRREEPRRAEPRNEPRSQPRAEPAREKPRNEPEVRRRKP